MANQERCDCKFQIHWNKLECMNPNICNERKINFVCLQKYILFKDNNKPAHWVGHSKLRSLEIDEFLKEHQTFMNTRLVFTE